MKETTMISLRTKFANAAILAAVAVATLAGSAAAATGPDAPPAAMSASGTVQIKPTIDEDMALAMTSFTFQGQKSFVVSIVPVTAGPVPIEQQWKLVPSGDGFSVNITNSAGATRCLDTVNAANPSLAFPAQCNGSTKQRWVIETSVGGQRIKNLAFQTVLVPNIFLPGVFGNAFTNPPSFSTVGKLQQSWEVG
jgi:hypothetical protein